MRIELGQKVKDHITGFSGTVTGRTEYITGCKQILIQPPVKEDGTFVDGRWMDEDRLNVIDEKKVSIAVENAGFDVAAPVR
jgi:hypothetical protein